VMITGDHPATALAIAQRLGIASAETQLITGAELDELDFSALEQRVHQLRVYARVTPQQKIQIHGTVSDLAVAGAIPRYLTLSAFLEEGLPIDVLERTEASVAKAAREVHVRIVAGDTKVLPRGHGDVLLITPLGGERRLEELEDDPLPRIC
jgi:hydrogenase maturation factor